MATVLLVDVPSAKVHLRVAGGAEDDAKVGDFLETAQEQAQLYLGRNVYATQEDLDAAIAAAPATLSAARAAYEEGLGAAQLLDDPVEYMTQERAVLARYWRARDTVDRVHRGILITAPVRTAILLTAANLWEHRGDEAGIQDLPEAAMGFLRPLRIGA